MDIKELKKLYKEETGQNWDSAIVDFIKVWDETQTRDGFSDYLNSYLYLRALNLAENQRRNMLYQNVYDHAFTKAKADLAEGTIYIDDLKQMTLDQIVELVYGIEV